MSNRTLANVAVAIALGVLSVHATLLEPRTSRPELGLFVALAALALWFLGFSLGWERARARTRSSARLLDARVHQLEAKLRIADLTIDSLRRSIADRSGYRGEQTASWRRPSA